MTKNLRLKLQADLTQCSICMDTMKKPKSLPCSHTFCIECLDPYLAFEDRHEEATIKCPICLIKVAIPSGELKELESNLIIEHLIEMRQDAKLSVPSRAEICRIC